MPKARGGKARLGVESNDTCCLICLDPQPQSALFSAALPPGSAGPSSAAAGCGHVACAECMQSYLQSALPAGAPQWSAPGPPCFDAPGGCIGRISGDLAAALLSPQHDDTDNATAAAPDADAATDATVTATAAAAAADAADAAAFADLAATDLECRGFASLPVSAAASEAAARAFAAARLAFDGLEAGPPPLGHAGLEAECVFLHSNLRSRGHGFSCMQPYSAVVTSSPPSSSRGALKTLHKTASPPRCRRVFST